MTFYTREQLDAMPIARLRLVDVRSKEEEEMVQEILDLKTETAPEPFDPYRGDVPDIMSKEEEEKWQAIIDARAHKAQVMIEPDVLPNLEEEEETEDEDELEGSPLSDDEELDIAPPVIQKPQVTRKPKAKKITSKRK